MLALPEFGWQVESHRDDQGFAITPPVLDVLSALLFLHHARGARENGIVPFTRYGLIRLLGWVGPDERSPRSRHYAQLERYIWHLRNTRILWSGPSVPDPLRHNKLVNGTLDFSFTGGRLLTNDPPGRKAPSEPPREGCSWVELSSTLRLLLAPNVERTPLALESLFGLPSGVSRQWWRVLSAMAGEQRDVEVPLDELLRRMGSSEDRAIPARARPLLERAHEAALGRTLLSAAPVFERRGGAGGRRWWVVYHRQPTVTPSDADHIVEHAVALGLSRALAEKYLLDDGPRFRDAVVAVLSGASGRLQRPGGWLRSAMEQGWVLPSPPADFSLPAPPPFAGYRSADENDGPIRVIASSPVGTLRPPIPLPALGPGPRLGTHSSVEDDDPPFPGLLEVGGREGGGTTRRTPSTPAHRDAVFQAAAEVLGLAFAPESGASVGLEDAPAVEGDLVEQRIEEHDVVG